MNHQNLYSSLAPLYDLGLSLNGYRRAVKYIARQLPFSMSDHFHLLDAGCGTGLYSIAIMNYFPHATGTAFDLNQRMAERMKYNVKAGGLENRTSVSTGNILSYVADKKHCIFDIIVTGGVLEYVDIDQSVKHLSHYLKRGGYWLNSPVKDTPIGKAIGWWMKFVPYSRSKNISVFSENGFDLIRKITLPWYSFPICLMKEVHIFRKR